MGKRGIRHIDRLINAVFDVLEDSNQTPELRMDAAKTLLNAMERRNPAKKKRSKEELAVERMLSGAPKKITPFSKPQ